ncbi:MAG: type II secretion system protein M [Gammaproteobacteria bacterium]|nr:type II secretion system protein M [Gammaproteobacteria bacterium]
MQEQFNKLLARIDGLNTRERLLVLAGGCVVIVLAWFVFLGEENLDLQERARTSIASLQTQIANIEAKSLQQDDTQSERQKLSRLDKLQDQAAEMDGRIQQFATELISPVEMARMLEKVLERRSSLRLRRLQNTGAEDLLPADSPGQNRLYRHGLVLELEGPYLAVLAYLEDLENLPWRLYWQRLEIDADEYPVNRIHIEVATLSLHEDWIGV